MKEIKFIPGPVNIHRKFRIKIGALTLVGIRQYSANCFGFMINDINCYINVCDVDFWEEINPKLIEN
jgi:hypothetical protein